MKPPRLGTILSGAILLGLVYQNLRSPAPLPPLGPFLDPVHGIWSVARQAELPDSATGRIAGLLAPVSISYDRRGVPHIFARTEDDATRALGYVVARDRLFQMEVQARAGGGTLAELVGAAALPLDREIRQLGLPDAARRRLSALDPEELRVLSAFSDGVNAWIAAAGARGVPLEYHLLGRRPAPWSPINTLHLVSRMGYVLALNDLEETVERARALLGPTVGDALYPRNSPVQEPIQPNGEHAPRLTNQQIPPPPEIALAPRGPGEPASDTVRATQRVALNQRGHSRPDTATGTQRVALNQRGHSRPDTATGTQRVALNQRGHSSPDTATATQRLALAPRGPGEPASDTVRATQRVAPSGLADLAPHLRAGDALGSNNWAVAPKRSADGHALLAGDQHLELTLPAIWYEVHLSVADSLDVYGVTIPGAPSVIIGFTRSVAWTFTNTEADVLDLYQETVDDSVSPTRYQLDGAWQPLRIQVETYRGAHGERIGRDTLRYTHRGPLRPNPAGPGWVSMRWTMLESPSDPVIFTRAAHSLDAKSWLAAMTGYRAPAQNMLVIDTTGNIAIRSTGRFPIRPPDRGDLIQPGATRNDDWIGDWSPESLPQALNPAQGFLASANQQPIDPRTTSRYLGANWYSPWRAMRINQLLRADSAMTPEGMRRIQVDPGSALADALVPALLNAASKFPERDSLRRAALLLAEWDRRYTVDNTRAVLFEEALSQLQLLLWDEIHRPGATLPHNPALAMILPLLRDSTNLWWDDRRTRAIVEQRDDLLASALTRALAATVSSYGEPTGNNWRWDKIRTINVRHLLRLPAFSALEIPNAGGFGTINPLSDDGTFGSSWRMVVEAGPEMHGWGAYPGGQSGNPLSSRYLDRLRSWRAGELDSLRFPRTAAELDHERTSILELTPAPRR